MLTRFHEALDQPGHKTFVPVDGSERSFTAPMHKGRLEVKALSVEMAGEHFRGWMFATHDGTDNFIEMRCVESTELAGIEAMLKMPMGGGLARQFVTTEIVRFTRFPDSQRVALGTANGLSSATIVDQIVAHMRETAQRWEH